MEYPRPTSVSRSTSFSAPPCSGGAAGTAAAAAAVRPIARALSAAAVRGRAVAARRPFDLPVVYPAVLERRQDRPLAPEARHLRRRVHVQPARVAGIRIRQRLLLDHGVVLVDRVLERVRVQDHLAVPELRVLLDPGDLRL